MMPEPERELALLEVELEADPTLEPALELLLALEADVEPELEAPDEAELEPELALVLELELALVPEAVPELEVDPEAELEPEPVVFVVDGVSSDLALMVTVPSLATFTHSPDFARTRFTFTSPVLDLNSTMSFLAYESCCWFKTVCPCSSAGFISFELTV